MPLRPKILLVDDDPSIRASLAFSFELEGFLVETFECAEELTERHEFPLAGCLVLDYRLPGLSGLALLQILRTRNVDLPAILITSAPLRNIREQAARAGATIVEKPLLCDALTAAVRSALNARKEAA